MKMRATPPALLLSGAEGAVPKLCFSLPGQAWDSRTGMPGTPPPGQPAGTGLAAEGERQVSGTSGRALEGGNVMVPAVISSVRRWRR
jgi:hypothetical protein